MVAAMPRAKIVERKPRTRLAPEVRRRQLVAVAARLLTEQGPAHLEIKELAEVAGVTRPVVYRFFPTRLKLVEAVLDDFITELTSRFHAALVRTLGAAPPESAEAFIEACCDTIETRGAGAWRLMYA